jgi:hypothetical protein
MVPMASANRLAPANDAAPMKVVEALKRPAPAKRAAWLK